MSVQRLGEHPLAPLVSQIVNKLQVSSLLDYGCGDANLFRSLKADHEMKLQCFDPEIPSFSGTPVPMQMVTCIDVLEHVKPEELNDVLADLVRVTEVVGFFHITLEKDGDLAYWVPLFLERFDVQTIQRTQTGFYAIVYSKPKPLVETLQ